MGWTAGTECCIGGLYGMSLTVPYIPWWLRDGMDSWDRVLCWGTPWDVPYCSIHPLGTEGLMDSWDRVLYWGTPWDVPYCPIHPLGTEGLMDSWDRVLSWGTPWDVPIHPLVAKGWDGQLGQSA